MAGFSVSENDNACIRGYILRSLVKGSRFSFPVKGLANKMVECGLISNSDISKQLYYLMECGLIELTDKTANAFDAMDKDAVARLTAKGIQFIENGGSLEMGIDL